MLARRNHAARAMREAIGNFRDGLLNVEWAYSNVYMLCVLKVVQFAIDFAMRCSARSSSLHYDYANTWQQHSKRINIIFARNLRNFCYMHRNSNKIYYSCK